MYSFLNTVKPKYVNCKLKLSLISQNKLCVQFVHNAMCVIFIQVHSVQTKKKILSVTKNTVHMYSLYTVCVIFIQVHSVQTKKKILYTCTVCTECVLSLFKCTQFRQRTKFYVGPSQFVNLN